MNSFACYIMIICREPASVYKGEHFLKENLDYIKHTAQNNEHLQDNYTLRNSRLLYNGGACLLRLQQCQKPWRQTQDDVLAETAALQCRTQLFFVCSWQITNESYAKINHYLSSRFSQGALGFGEKACCSYTNSDCVRSTNKDDELYMVVIIWKWLHKIDTVT